MKTNRKPNFLIAAIILLLIFTLLTASRSVMGQVGEDFNYKLYLPIIYGDGTTYKQTPTPTDTPWIPPNPFGTPTPGT